ncbi:hypothetical protein, partial [Pectobacterium actinidiae]|uniref:hypothetical protein n=1 Tax=Pectobacterium actinidiae TaxID=1507808 RepID=UPI0019815AB4
LDNLYSYKQKFEMQQNPLKHQKITPLKNSKTRSISINLINKQIISSELELMLLIPVKNNSLFL